MNEVRRVEFPIPTIGRGVPDGNSFDVILSPWEKAF